MAGRRVWRNLPVYHAGTPGRPSKRHISRSARSAAAAGITAPDSAVAPRIPLPTIFRVNPALTWSVSPTTTTTSLPPSRPTDFAYIHPQLHPHSIRLLLRAIDSRCMEAVWHHFSNLLPDDRPHLTPAILSDILLSLRPKRQLPIDARAYFDYYHPSYDPALYATLLARLPKRQHAEAWFMSRVERVLAEYRATNTPLGTPECAHLLDIARATGNLSMARDIWTEMDSRGIMRNTKCYNTYIAALCGSTLTTATWKINARTVALRVARGGAEAERTQKAMGDTSTRALALFDEMLRKGFVPDMATFEFLLLAVAKMGNLPVVKSLVWRCWGVDIAAPFFSTEAVGGIANSDLSSPTFAQSPSAAGYQTHQEPTSPTPLHLLPTPTTFTNIACAFSRLSHPSIAIRLINHLSITYTLPIPFATWQQLTYWTYVFTRPPAATRVMREKIMPQLWRVMRRSPYNVEPDIEMFDLMIRHHLRGQRYKWANKLLTEVLRPNCLWDSLNKKLAGLRARVEREVGWGYPRAYAPEADNLNHNRRAPLSHLLRTNSLTTATAAMDFRLHRARSLIRRWIELLIQAVKIDDDFPRQTYRRVVVPNLINAYGKDFLGAEVGYVIEESGYVQIRALDGVLGLDVPLNVGANYMKYGDHSMGVQSRSMNGEGEGEGEGGDGYEEKEVERVDLVPRVGDGIQRCFERVHIQRESVRWRWKNRGNKYGEWRPGMAKGEGSEAQGGMGVIGKDTTKLGPPTSKLNVM